MAKKIISRKTCINKMIKHSRLKRLIRLKKLQNFKLSHNNKLQNINNNNKNNNKQKKSKTDKKNNQKNNIQYPKQTLKPIKNHYYTFQQLKDLYTLLYTSLVFQWISKEKLVIIVSLPKTGYILEIFLKSFKFNCVFIDQEMPVNTNNHFYSQFIKGVYQIIILNTKYSENSPKFPYEITKETNSPLTLIYFNTTDKNLLEYHSYNMNVKSIYHFMVDKDQFINDYNELEENIVFSEFEFDYEQMTHLRYRCEDNFNSIKKSEIKKEKTRKINIELLHSKKMEDFFKKNPQEKQNIIKTIQENTNNTFKPSASYIPSYLIHSNSNSISNAIKNTYMDNMATKNNRGKRRKKVGKMESYFEAFDKGDGSHKLIEF